MKTHKTSLMIAGVISALALIAPMTASAAPDGRYADRGYEGRGYESRGRFDDRGYWHGFDARISEMRDRLERGRYNGALTRYEYRGLRDRLDSIAYQKRSFQRTGHGINHREAALLDAKLDRLSAEIRYEKHDRDYGRGHGYGRH
jgi:hypothetical protein